MNSDFYVVGGTMEPDAPSYIERKADTQLYEHILAGDFCYVLTSRQTGKSSLMARTGHKLKKQGTQTAIIELTQIGGEQEKKSADLWYHAFAEYIAEELDIKIDLRQWWKEQEKLPALRRLTKFFKNVVLQNINEQIVIFIDEIDTTIALPFTDDFFAAIRSCYNLRATHPEYKRLSFVLLGVASPSQLIKDVRRTPFNIGYQIDLNDFTFEEAEPLSYGLGLYDLQREKAMKRILYWTGGHPYLTQKLCDLLVKEKPGANINEGIDKLVKRHFLAPASIREDNNLKFVSERMQQIGNKRKMLFKSHQERNKKYSKKLLKFYQRIYQGEMVTYESNSLTHQSLKLIGIVIPRTDRKLSIRNPIYESVFTMDWARDVMPVNWGRNYSIASGIIILAFIIVYIYVASGFIKKINSARDNVPISEYETLRKFPGYKGKADCLMADYWDRRAVQSEEKGNQDEGLLYRLKALTVEETDRRWIELGKILKDYWNLIITYPYKNSVLSVAFDPNYVKYVLTGDDRRIVRLWELAKKKPIKVMTHRNPIKSTALSPDGQKVLTGSKDGTVKLWYVDKKNQPGKINGKLMKHENWVNSVAFSPDGKILVSGSSDGTARLWQADTGESLGSPMKHSFPVNCVAFSPDGKTVLTGSEDGTARLWQTNTGQLLGTPMKHDSPVNTAAFSPDGKIVLIGSSDGMAQLWEIDTREQLGPPLKNSASISSTALSPDGKIVLTGCSDGTARLWQIDTGELLGTPMRHNSSINSAAFHPDGKTVLTGSSDGTVRLWKVDTRKYLETTFKNDSLKPKELLEQWQNKLVLILNEETGKIEPLPEKQII